MRTSIIPHQIFLPQDAVKLGRFVTDIERPHHNYHDPEPLEIQPRILVSSRGSYRSEHIASNDSGFTLTLTSLISTGLSKRAKATISIATEIAKTYALDNSDGWFDQVTGLGTTRRWMERAFDRGHTVYMIVGFHTVTDAQVSQESVAGDSVDGHLDIPASLSLAAAGVVIPFGSAIDPGVGIEAAALHGTRSQLVARGEQVRVLEYRKVCHSWLSSKRVGEIAPIRGPSLAIDGAVEG